MQNNAEAFPKFCFKNRNKFNQGIKSRNGTAAWLTQKTCMVTDRLQRGEEKNSKHYFYHREETETYKIDFTM